MEKQMHYTKIKNLDIVMYNTMLAWDVLLEILKTSMRTIFTTIVALW